MYDIIIIGGGASGLFCSINAPQNSKKLIIEKQETLGNNRKRGCKVKINLGQCKTKGHKNGCILA